jgi:hypothetical protein
MIRNINHYIYLILLLYQSASWFHPSVRQYASKLIHRYLISNFSIALYNFLKSQGHSSNVDDKPSLTHGFIIQANDSQWSIPNVCNNSWTIVSKYSLLDGIYDVTTASRSPHALPYISLPFSVILFFINNKHVYASLGIYYSITSNIENTSIAIFLFIWWDFNG